MTARTPQLYFFLMLRTRESWLALPRPERQRIASETLTACSTMAPDVSFRYFDAEAFSARCSDILMVSAPDITRYSFVIEQLRDSPIFSVPYFDLVDIIPALEEGYRHYEAFLERA